ncbi:DUF1127 domain-containing protein [Mesorhizobium sp.]|uniref:DUF1127 domain-containing protein n=1 Tax=Mesorhizobium sp. TaxID=1871066 RepID=UPI003BAA3209
MTNILASTPRQAARKEALARRSTRRPLAALRSMIAHWRERTRHRWDLKRIARDNPRLIDDIGLTRRQAEEEIAKLPFWQR